MRGACFQIHAKDDAEDPAHFGHARFILRLIRAGNGGQGATALPAFTATLTLWNLQLTESKGAARVRIPLSPPNWVL